MLQILLLILKILGILLLVILGIVLVVLLLILFVPVRYRGDVSFDGRLQGNVLVSWLLRLITIRVHYDGSVNAFVRVLWFRLFDKTVWTSEETEKVADELETEEVLSDIRENAAEAGDEIVQAMEAVQRVDEVPSHAAEPESEHTQKTPITEKDGADKTGAAPHTGGTGNSAPEEPGTGKQPLFEKMIKKILAVVKRMIDKIISTYRQITGRVQEGQEKIDKVHAFFEDQENRGTIHLLRKQAVKLFRHVFPQKIRGRVCFGFEDPYITGKILMYISPFYSLYAKSVTVEPVFDEKVLEGDLHFKGRVRAGSLIWIAVRVFFNKNFRKLLKAWRRKGK